ncbi:hypothetical protein AOLI_G00084650 [Acnodon oligacanthus]
MSLRGSGGLPSRHAEPSLITQDGAALGGSFPASTLELPLLLGGRDGRKAPVLWAQRAPCGWHLPITTDSKLKKGRAGRALSSCSGLAEFPPLSPVLVWAAGLQEGTLSFTRFSLALTTLQPPHAQSFLYLKPRGPRGAPPTGGEQERLREPQHQRRLMEPLQPVISSMASQGGGYVAHWTLE